MMNEFLETSENSVPQTFEEAISRIAFLTEKLRVKEGENADLQASIEVLIAENRDTIEKKEALDIELDRIRKLQAKEHEKRRLHILHVRELRKAIADRDARIRELSETLNAARPHAEVMPAPLSGAPVEAIIGTVEPHPALTDLLSPADAFSSDTQPQPVVVDLLTPETDVLPETADATPSMPEPVPQFAAESAPATSEPPVTPRVEVAQTPVLSTDEIKTLQSDIAYKEDDIDSAQRMLAGAQNDMVDLKEQKDRINSTSSALIAELSEKDRRAADLAEKIRLLEEELEPYKKLKITPEEIEKLKMNTEIKEFLEDEIDKKLEDDSKGADAGSADAGSGAEENERQESPLTEVEEIKSKFQKLMSERDGAIALLDKFEVEAKTKEYELNNLKKSYDALAAESQNYSTQLKEKDNELSDVYGAFSKYKEESGFMTRENKMLKDERGELLARCDELKNDLKAGGEKMAEIEAAMAEKEKEMQALIEERNSEIARLAEDGEANIKKMQEEFEARMNEIKESCDLEMQRMRENGEVETGQLKAAVDTVETNYHGAVAELQNMRSNLDSLFNSLNDALNEGQPEAAEENGPGAKITVVPEALFLLDEDAGGEPAVPGKISGILDALNVKYACSSFNSYFENIDSATQYLCLFLKAEDKSEAMRVYEVYENAGRSPVVAYSENGGLPVFEMTTLLTSGAVRDYIDTASMSDSAVENVIVRVLENKISRIGGLSAKKDDEECKLRESVVLNIDNRVKANRIGELTKRIDYLKETNRKLKRINHELQKSYDEIIAIITNLSLQEAPQVFSDGFNEITNILLKVTSIK